MVAVFGLAVAALAFCWLGPLGAIAGLGAGLLAGGWAAAKGRFYRPQGPGPPPRKRS
jgi:hypothetical protein